MMTEPSQSIFHAIQVLACSSASHGGPQKWQSSVESAVAWLATKRLTREAKSLRLDPSRDPALLFGPGGQPLLGVPSHRVQRKKKAEIKRLKTQKLKTAGPQASTSNLDRLWNEYNNPAAAVSIIDIDRVPADALAFYKPFHFSPHDEWGIYMLVGPLLNYCSRL
jgi:hypothetical protein